jgi:hypothetical protein
MATQVSLSDLIEKEARALARDFLERELAKQDLPLPKDTALDIHLNQLLEADPNLRLRAKARVEAKQDAFSLSLAALGIEREVIDTSDFTF